MWHGSPTRSVSEWPSVDPTCPIITFSTFSTTLSVRNHSVNKGSPAHSAVLTKCLAVQAVAYTLAVAGRQ